MTGTTTGNGAVQDELTNSASAFEQDTGDDATSGGAPKWMVTFGDSLTLLLTFFVLIYTFSQPDKRAMGMLMEKMGDKKSPGGVKDAAQSNTNLVPERRLLMAARSNTSGAEKPPLYGQLAADEKAKFPADVDIEHRAKFGEVLSVTIPLKRLFKDAGKTISKTGRAVLDKVSKIVAMRPCTVVVKTRPLHISGDRAAAMTAKAIPLVEYLRNTVDSDFASFRISPDLQLGESQLIRGQCEIFILAE